MTKQRGIIIAVLNIRMKHLDLKYKIQGLMTSRGGTGSKSGLRVHLFKRFNRLRYFFCKIYFLLVVAANIKSSYGPIPT